MEAAEARLFWQQLERGRQQPQQPRQRGEAAPCGAVGAVCAGPPPHDPRVRAAWAKFRLLAPLGTQEAHSSDGAQLAALTAPARQARRASGVQRDGASQAEQLLKKEQDEYNGKKEYCGSQLDLSEGKRKEVERSGSQRDLSEGTKKEVERTLDDTAGISSEEHVAARTEEIIATEVSSKPRAKSFQEKPQGDGGGMRLPRGRRRWADSDDEDFDIFAPAPISDAEDASAAAASSAGAADPSSSAAPAREPARGDRFDVMDELLSRAAEANQAGARRAALEFCAQAQAAVLNGGVDYRITVNAETGGFQAVTDMTVAAYAGHVMPSEVEARHSALAEALQGLEDILRRLLQKCREA